VNREVQTIHHLQFTDFFYRPPRLSPVERPVEVDGVDGVDGCVLCDRPLFDGWEVVEGCD
jgi:hypothetical protein